MFGFWVLTPVEAGAGGVVENSILKYEKSRKSILTMVMVVIQ